MPLLSLKWKSGSQTGPEPAVVCPREPGWAWLPKRLPFGTATGVDDFKLCRPFFGLGLCCSCLVFIKVRGKKLQHGKIGFIIRWQLCFQVTLVGLGYSQFLVSGN